MFRTTFFFTNLRSGWSETFYSATATSLQTALDNSIVLADKRIGCISGPAALNYIRVSDDEVLRDSLISIPSDRGRYNKDLVDPADAPFSAVLVRLQSGPLYRRPWYLRGMPDNVITGGGEYTPSAQWRGLLNALTIELISGRWALKAVNKVPPPSLTTAAIPLIPFPGQWSFTFPGAVPFTPGSRARVSGARVTKALNGVWRVVSSAGNLLTLFRADAPASGTWEPTIAVKQLNYQLFPIDQAVVRGGTHRIQGRPFDLHRGRAKARTAI